MIAIIHGCEKSTPFENVACIESDSYVVFKPCRRLTYQAKFWDAGQNLISNNKIWIMATGNPWEYSDRQQELYIAYEYDSSQIKRISNYVVNKTLNNINWKRKEVTGVIENKNSIWMHPFRSNQYNFMEVAPFPSVQLPLEVGKTWSSKLNIYNGWGDWSNTTLLNSYEIIGYEEIQTPFNSLEAWHINSRTEAPFGNSTNNFWLHTELGFVKMVIHNYAGQTLEIILTEVSSI